MPYFSYYIYRAGILGVVTARLCCDDALGLTDAAAVPIVAAGWSLQEWAIHKYLLHGMKVYTFTTDNIICICIYTEERWQVLTYYYTIKVHTLADACCQKRCPQLGILSSLRRFSKMRILIDGTKSHCSHHPSSWMTYI